MIEKYKLIEKYLKGTATDEEVGRLIEILDDERLRYLSVGNVLDAFILSMVIIGLLFKDEGDEVCGENV